MANLNNATPFDNFIPVVPTVDPLTHTLTQPFCKVDPSCPCHEDRDNIATVNQHVQDGLVTPHEATQIVQGKQI